MALFLPAALSLKSFAGGYNGKLDFSSLSDNQTNDALNVELGYTIKKSNGYVRILNTALTETGLRKISGGLGTSKTGDAVMGHYQFFKQSGETEIEKNVVAAGSNLWDYSVSATNANIILSGLKYKKDSSWYFTQLMSPLDGSDDVVIGVNEENNPIMWNGTDASATFLSSVAGADGVVPSKFIVSTKNRICLLNIKDTTDADAGSKFILSDFDSNGTPTPHIFPDALFAYAGGSDRYGPINGAATLNGDIVIFKRNSIYYFTIGGGSTIDPDTLAIVHDFNLKQVDENIGCAAPSTIASIGNAIIFLSDIGVYAFDGTNLVYISEALERDFKNINFSRKHLASAAYHRGKNQYWLSIASSGKDFNDMVFVYDLTKKIWYAPQDDMRCNVLSNYKVNGEERLLSGDHLGYCYLLDEGSAKGQYLGRSYDFGNYDVTGTSVTIPLDILTDVSGDRYEGLSMMIVGSNGHRETRMITLCCAAGISSVFTIDNPFKPSSTVSSTIHLAPIYAYYRTKDYDFGASDMDKTYIGVTVRARQLGDINYKMNYIVDFNELSNAGSATVTQYSKKHLCWSDTSANVTGSLTRWSGTLEADPGVNVSSITVSAGTDLSASNLVGYTIITDYYNSRFKSIITAGECNTMQLLEANVSTSYVVAQTETTYMINPNTQNTWDNALWGPAKTKSTMVSVRCLYTQPPVGKYFSLRFLSERPNEPFEIFSFDILTKQIGRK